jgi:ParB family chromosome partitioning protein
MMTEIRVEQIPRKSIRWPAQERKHFGKEELLELAATITVHGLIEPIGVVRDGEGYRGLWGQRRCMAFELAGLDFIPAIVREKPGSEAETIELRLVENIAREQLRPIEQAVGLDQLMKASGLGASEVAKRVGLKVAAVSKSLSLLQLPGPIRQQVEDGTISPAAGHSAATV